ncbi:MAG: hypothetical protein EBU90_30230 [Proteobacteria bacterium]|nr:hypothetical protein [Pseudomonadota bacterium]
MKIGIQTLYFSTIAIAVAGGLFLAFVTSELVNDIKRKNNIIECLRVQGTDLKYCETLVDSLGKK